MNQTAKRILGMVITATYLSLVGVTIVFISEGRATAPSRIAAIAGFIGVFFLGLLIHTSFQRRIAKF
jgi:hypothetical protein